VALCRSLRARRDARYVYFILMSSRDSREEFLAGLEAGADDFLRKPLDIEELGVRVRGAQRILALQDSLRERNEQLGAALGRINEDIRAAGELQRVLLPSAELDSSRCRMRWTYLPSATVSGDAVNFFRLDEHHIGFYNVDVAGHGVASGMIGMLLAQSLDPHSPGSLLFVTDDQGRRVPASPSECVAALNAQMMRFRLGSTYLTCTYGVLDERDGGIRYVRAGHTTPLLLAADGSCRCLDEEGDMPVGMFDFASFHDLTLRLSAGERLVLYSDGVTENESPDGEEYGTQRLAAFLAAQATGPSADISSGLAREMHTWCASEGPFKDDVSLLLIEYDNGAGPMPA
jgi:phosphoserine phosphatase RsbU/P